MNNCIQIIRFCVYVFLPVQNSVLWQAYNNKPKKNNNNDLVYFLLLFCTGRPQPQVRWLVNGVLVDDQYEHNTGDVIENRLLWPAVQRSDLNAIFTCQAVNTILVEPKENSYVLDLHRKYYSSVPRIWFSLCYSMSSAFLVKKLKGGFLSGSRSFSKPFLLCETIYLCDSFESSVDIYNFFSSYTL